MNLALLERLRSLIYLNTSVDQNPVTGLNIRQDSDILTRSGYSKSFIQLTGFAYSCEILFSFATCHNLLRICKYCLHAL